MGVCALRQGIQRTLPACGVACTLVCVQARDSEDSLPAMLVCKNQPGGIDSDSWHSGNVVWQVSSLQ
jgi:hypothetical protein